MLKSVLNFPISFLNDIISLLFLENKLCIFEKFLFPEFVNCIVFTSPVRFIKSVSNVVKSLLYYSKSLLSINISAELVSVVGVVFSVFKYIIILLMFVALLLNIFDELFRKSIL